MSVSLSWIPFCVSLPWQRFCFWGSILNVDSFILIRHLNIVVSPAILEVACPGVQRRSMMRKEILFTCSRLRLVFNPFQCHRSPSAVFPDSSTQPSRILQSTRGNWDKAQSSPLILIHRKSDVFIEVILLQLFLLLFQLTF